METVAVFAFVFTDVLVDLPDNLLIDTNIDIGQSIYNITAVDVYFRNTTGVVTLMSPSENFDVINSKPFPSHFIYSRTSSMARTLMTRLLRMFRIRF